MRSQMNTGMMPITPFTSNSLTLNWVMCMKSQKRRSVVLRLRSFGTSRNRQRRLRFELRKITSKNEGHVSQVRSKTRPACLLHLYVWQSTVARTNVSKGQRDNLRLSQYPQRPDRKECECVRTFKQQITTIYADVSRLLFRPVEDTNGKGNSQTIRPLGL